jgi:hypothetical protein
MVLPFCNHKMSLGARFSNQTLNANGELTVTVKPRCGATKCGAFALI